jgi:hypothetical protein
MSWLTLINVMGNYFKWNFIQHNIGHETLGTTHQLKVKNKIRPRNSYPHLKNQSQDFNLNFRSKANWRNFPNYE